MSILVCVQRLLYTKNVIDKAVAIYSDVGSLKANCFCVILTLQCTRYLSTMYSGDIVNLG